MDSKSVLEANANVAGNLMLAKAKPHSFRRETGNKYARLCGTAIARTMLNHQDDNVFTRYYDRGTEDVLVTDLRLRLERSEPDEEDDSVEGQIVRALHQNDNERLAVIAMVNLTALQKWDSEKHGSAPATVHQEEEPIVVTRKLSDEDKIRIENDERMLELKANAKQQLLKLYVHYDFSKCERKPIVLINPNMDMRKVYRPEYEEIETRFKDALLVEPDGLEEGLNLANKRARSNSGEREERGSWGRPRMDLAEVATRYDRLEDDTPFCGSIATVHMPSIVRPLLLDEGKMGFDEFQCKLSVWPATVDCDSEDCIGVCIVAGEAWDRAPFTQRRDAFSCCSVLVVRAGSDRCNTLGIADWNSQGIDTLINTAALYNVKVSSDDSEQLRSASVSQLIERILRCEKMAIDCQFVPVTNDVVTIPVGSCRDFDDASFTILSNTSDYTWETKTQPIISLGSKWVNISTASTLNDIRVTPAGLGTYLSSILGAKLVCIPNSQKLKLVKEGYVNPLDMTDWCAILIDEGCELFIPPGTPYFEVNTSSCLTIGGYFYCSKTFSTSMISILAQHYFGLGPCSLLDGSAPIVFFKILDLLVQTLVRRAHAILADEEGTPVEHLLPARFPSWNESACLLLLVNHLDQLMPLSRGDSNNIPWQETYEFKADHAYAKELVLQFVEVASPIFPEFFMVLSTV
ncbi:hypothetical protein EW145_g3768 [Phellinidium pouzarii]|uniref:JmjC domain-containing protein n=1 Tax=Phellinidium pouzarii TaxID=167371 RepID=A0A4S4LB64_9AGAM|nr:hypothetical protein EW145_g3768 [Phellinidium pouzarii]